MQVIPLTTALSRSRALPTQEGAGYESLWNAPDGDVVVAVFGTGVDIDHPALEGRVIGGKSFTGEPWYEDHHGFGTAVAGVNCLGTEPPEDWRVDEVKALSDGRYDGRAFVQLREQTEGLAPDQVPPYREKLESAWKFSGEDLHEALTFTGQMRGLMDQGLPLEESYQTALREAARAEPVDSSLEFEIGSDYILIGDTELPLLPSD